MEGYYCRIKKQIMDWKQCSKPREQGFEGMRGDEIGYVSARRKMRRHNSFFTWI
jgi:hypothetical protein